MREGYDTFRNLVRLPRNHGKSRQLEITGNQEIKLHIEITIFRKILLNTCEILNKYKIHERNLKYIYKSEEKDLGVWFSSNLKPSLQCQKNSARAMQALDLGRRSFKYLTKESLTTLYQVYVRPHLEYCVQSWSPYFAKDIDMLEHRYSTLRIGNESRERIACHTF